MRRPCASTRSRFGQSNSNVPPDLAGGGPAAGLSFYFEQTAGIVAADKWQADGGWQSTGLSVPANPNDTRLYSTPTGQAVARWYSGVGPTYSVAAYSGSAWSDAATTKQDGGAAQVYDQFAVLSNGDAIFMFMHYDEIQVVRFHAGTGIFDAPVTVEAMPNELPDGTGRHLVAVDSADRLTIAWARQESAVTHTFTSRSFNQGATWTAPEDFGPSNFVSLAVDPSGDVIAATYGNGMNAGSGLGDPGIYLRATSPMGTMWSTPFQTNVETNQGGNYGALYSSARVLFDTKSHVIVVAVQYDPDAGAGYTLQSVTCSL